MTTKIPQVILLGNGINRAYGGASWNELLKEISSGKYKDVDKLRCPMPLKAILVTDDHINGTLKSYIAAHREEAYGTIKDENHAHILQSLLSIGADHILTTNYSYELEIAAFSDRGSATESHIKNLQDHTEYVEKAEPQYLLSTFNRVNYGYVPNKIWHIHGEARKPSSVILGHFYYGELLYHLKDYVKKEGGRYLFAQKNDKEWHLKSWIDAFIMGDVYILGAKLDLSEIDLWWLIGRKKREGAEHGKLYFYEPAKEQGKDGDIDERLELIKIFAEVKDMGIKLPEESDDPTAKQQRTAAYREFYKTALTDIADKIHNSNYENL